MALDSQQLAVIMIVAKTGFNVIAMFAKSYFALPVNHNKLDHFFDWNIYNFTCLPILEGNIIVMISKMELKSDIGQEKYDTQW